MGTIIIPVVVPSDIEPSVALQDNERFKVVWSVLNALRAHDDRFNATINKIDLNKKKPPQISVVGVPGNMLAMIFLKWEKRTQIKNSPNSLLCSSRNFSQLYMPKMVQKVGDRVYWERWAKDVAVIAQNQKARLNELVLNDKRHTKLLKTFWKD